MNADLPHLGAGYPVLRSKICQGGRYDAVIRSATEPEVSPKPYSTSQGANQDIRALKMPSKEQPEAKTIIAFKRDFSYFHKAQDQENGHGNQKL